VEIPSRRHATLLGVSGALALLTKFTSIAFFPCCLLGLLAWRRIVVGRNRKWLPDPLAVKRVFTIAMPVMFLVIWAGYQFRIGSLLWRAPVEAMTPDRHALHGVFYTGQLEHFPGE
jgi:hypothetical protein